MFTKNGLTSEKRVQIVNKHRKNIQNQELLEYVTKTAVRYQSLTVMYKICLIMSSVNMKSNKNSLTLNKTILENFLMVLTKALIIPILPHNNFTPRYGCFKNE